MDLPPAASLYPAISDSDLLALPFPKLDEATSAQIVAAVQNSHAARRRATPCWRGRNGRWRSQSRIRSRRVAILGGAVRLSDLSLGLPGFTSSLPPRSA